MRPFKTRNKYGARKTNGYDSKREAEYAWTLGMRQKAENGDVLYWLEQVPVKLSVGKYVIDFLVFKRDGTHQYVEVKGVELPAWKLKMLALQNERPDVYERLEVVS